MIRAYPRHVRQCDLCMPGARVWFERYKLNYSDFVFSGIDVEILEATGDHFGIMVATRAREEEKEGAQNGQG